MLPAAPVKTMTVLGVEYVEAKPQDAPEVCSQCAFGQLGTLGHCAMVIDHLSKPAFGGDCQQRDVIYLRKA